MSRLSEVALIAQVVTTGSHLAFGRLVEAHQEPVRRFLRRLTGGDVMQADDLAQETFIRAWKGLKGFRGTSNFETWLFKIAYRTFLDSATSLSSEAETVSSEECRQIQAAPDTFSIHYDLDKALATLTEAERTCVVLQCVEGQSIKEIAQITGMNENTVKSHLLRGKKNLANYLRNNGYEGKNKDGR